MIRISRRRSIPEHHESVLLRPLARGTGWLVALASIGGGLTLVAGGSGAVSEVLGPIVVILGGIVLAAMWQCRRYEVTVGTARVDIGVGPFRDTLAAGAVLSATGGPATGWRRLFVDEEVTVRVDVGSRREFRIPSGDPAALVAVLVGREVGPRPMRS